MMLIDEKLIDNRGPKKWEELDLHCLPVRIYFNRHSIIWNIYNMSQDGWNPRLIMHVMEEMMS